MKLATLTRMAFAGLVLVIAACGQNSQKAAEAPAAPPAPTPEAYVWDAVAPSTAETGPPASLHLAGGYAYALLAHTAVAAGDAVTAHMTLQGEAGRWVRVVLQRHCDTANGDDNQTSNLQLNGQPQTLDVNATFQHTFSCLRVSLVSMDSHPLAVTVNDLTVTKAAGASALRGSGGG